MAALTRWSPFTEVAEMRNMMDRLFDDSLFGPYRRGWVVEGGYFPMDVYTTKDDLVVKATLPGVKPEEVDINIENNTLSIKCEVQEPQDVEEAGYLLRERRWGTFQRAVTLPSNLQTDKTEASFEDGILTIRIPKAEEAKPKKITINPVHRIEGKRA